MDRDEEIISNINCLSRDIIHKLCEVSLPKSGGPSALGAFLAKIVRKGVVLMNKVTNCFEGIDIYLGLVVLKFKKRNVSDVTIARKPRRANELSKKYYDEPYFLFF